MPRCTPRVCMTSTAAGLCWQASQRLTWLQRLRPLHATCDIFCVSQHPPILTRCPFPGSQAVLFHQLDIASPGSVDAFAKWAAEELRHVDILVNNAGARRASDAPRRAPLAPPNRQHERGRRG